MRTCFSLQLYDDGVENTKKQLMTVCPGLQEAQPQLLENLLSVWKGVRDRLFKHYHFAAKAYFMYLRMGSVVRPLLSQEVCRTCITCEPSNWPSDWYLGGHKLESQRLSFFYLSDHMTNKCFSLPHFLSIKQT